MAIMGFLVHTLPDCASDVEEDLKNFPEITTYGVHQDCYVVAVADAEASGMEALLDRAKALEGVLTCYVTSMHMDEEE